MGFPGWSLADLARVPAEIRRPRESRGGMSEPAALEERPRDCGFPAPALPVRPQWRGARADGPDAVSATQVHRPVGQAAALAGRAAQPRQTRGINGPG